MKHIKQLYEHIDEELDGSKDYIDCALEYKTSNPDLANIYYKLSMQELEHVNIFKQLIDDWLDEKGDDYESVSKDAKDLYDYMNKKILDEIVELKILHSIFK